MKQLINDFALQIDEALAIGEAANLNINIDNVHNIVTCGLGGSGIGGSFLKDATKQSISVPLEVVKGYFLPKYVNENSLVIISSYSGNTEETLACFKVALERNAKIVAISSNGKVEEISKENGIDLIKIPGGKPPRSSFAYSAVQLFYILAHFKLIDNSFKDEFKAASQLLKDDRDAIMSEADGLAEKLQDKYPVLYSSDHIEAVTIRWRQQINENGKQLCWHHVIPEMNHNELVGWRQEDDKLAVVFLRDKEDFSSISKRMDLNKIVCAKYTSNVFEVWAKGNSFIEKSIYLIHLGDWISYFLSEYRGFDTTEVQVIDELKASLK